MCAALRELSGQVDLGRAEGICITAQRESFVPVDRQGRPLRNAILWLDERSREQVEALVKTFGRQELHTLTGKPPSMSLALPKIGCWIRMLTWFTACAGNSPPAWPAPTRWAWWICAPGPGRST